MRGKDRDICEMRESGMKHEPGSSNRLGFARERGDRRSGREDLPGAKPGSAVCRFPFPNRMRFSVSVSEFRSNPYLFRDGRVFNPLKPADPRREPSRVATKKLGYCNENSSGGRRGSRRGVRRWAPRKGGGARSRRCASRQHRHIFYPTTPSNIFFLSPSGFPPGRVIATSPTPPRRRSDLPIPDLQAST